MALVESEKAQIIKSYKQSEHDTGSPEVQIALLTARINGLTEHLKIHKHDFHTRYGLGKLVSQRRKMMRYLKTKSPTRYQKIIKALDIRG
jgi:small subunit ribosomal protein S15